MKYLIVPFFILFLSFHALADSVTKLLERATEYQESNPDSCIYLSQKALTLIKDDQVVMRASAYWNLSQGYLYKHRYHTALFYALRGKELFEEDETKRIYQDILATIGWIYFDIGNYHQAEPFHQKALITAQRRNDIRSEVLYTNALGLDVLNTGQETKSLAYFRKGLFIMNQLEQPDKDLRATIENNIGIVYIKQENWQKAEEYLLSSVGNSSGTATALLETYAHLARVYLKTHQLDKCQNVLIKADELRHQTSYSFSLMEYYQVRYKYEQLVGNIQAAFDYQDKYIDLYQKVHNQEAQTVMNFLLDAQQEKIEQDELVIQQAEKLKYNRNLLISVVVVFTIIVVIGFYYLFKSKAEKAYLRQEILARELEKEKQQQAELSDKLAYKDEAIETMALTMSKRNELIKSLAVSVSKSDSKEIKDAWKKFEYVFNQDRKTNILSEEFVKDFRYRLQRRYKNLTEKDLQLIIDIRNNLTSKEMADKYHIEVKSIEMSRYRLRKKLNLDTGVQLKNFIMEL